MRPRASNNAETSKLQAFVQQKAFDITHSWYKGESLRAQNNGNKNKNNFLCSGNLDVIVFSIFPALFFLSFWWCFLLIFNFSFCSSVNVFIQSWDILACLFTYCLPSRSLLFCLDEKIHLVQFWLLNNSIHFFVLLLVHVFSWYHGCGRFRHTREKIRCWE